TGTASDDRTAPGKPVHSTQPYFRQSPASTAPGERDSGDATAACCVAVFTIGYSCASRGADSWLIRRCSVVQGCLDDPGATVEAIDDDGWPHTGD
ncbi:hypothetical protein CHL72_12450, partial [Streptococcus pneumoniae]